MTPSSPARRSGPLGSPTSPAPASGASTQPSHPRRDRAMTTSYAARARSPAASPSPSPTEVGAGLSRRQSWNSSLAEAINMRDLSGAGVSGSTPQIHHQPLDSDYGGGLTATPKSTISMALPNFGNSETLTRPSLEYAATIRSEELDRLTPHAPDRGHGRSPSSRRVFDTSDGRMLPRPGTLDIIARSPTVRRVSESLRSASERVVNIMGSEKSGYEGISRLPTRDEDSSTSADSPISPYTSRPDDGEPPQPPPPPRPYAAPPTAALRGRTLGIFSAHNPVRVLMDRILRFPLTEPGILMLIIINVIVLTIQAAPLLTAPREPGGFFRSWADYVLFVLYIVFTVEMFARIIVTGLIIDPDTSVTEWFRGLWRWARYRARTDEDEDDSDVIAPQVWRQRGKSFAMAQERAPKKTTLAEAPFQEAVARQHGILVEGRPYLRHSWHRIDMAAIVMFWIMFIVASVGDEITSDRHLFIFRALSVLRATRLLVITSGTATILHSLKRAGPLLLNVSVFVIFGAVLFSIIGVQSFRGSLRRQCVLYDPFNNSNPVDTGKNCGGWVHPTTAEIMPFYNQDGSLSEIKPKGYVCPINLECWTADENGQFNAVGFDNIFLSLVQVIVVASINTWTGTMYECMDSDFFSSALYFIACAIVLNFWLMNLIVAVVVNVFKDIRSSTKQSAFGADQSILNQPDWVANTKKPREISHLLKWYHKTEIVWVLLIVVDLIAQAFKTANSSDAELQLLKSMEIGFAFVWDVEMVIRMAGYFPDTPPYSPDWRAFLRSGRNDFDLFLAVGCSIIQIPAVRNSSVYSWLTVLQLLRWYRVILAFPRMRPLLANVFGSFAGMFNMVIFLFLMNFLSGLMAVQLLRGDMSGSEYSGELINFGQIYNSFLGMYQIFSTENWTAVLYSAMGAEWQWGQGWIVCIFLCVWFLFANFILMQMFIAVINENFEIAEEQKRKVQIEAFIRKTEPRSAHVTWMERFNPYRLIKARHKAVKVDTLPPNLILPLKQSIGADVGAPKPDNATGARAAMKRAFGMQELDHLPMRHLIDRRRSVAPTARQSTHISMHAGGGSVDVLEDDYDDDRGLTDLLPPITAGPTVDEHMDEIRERRNQQADFIAAHPSYDRSLWIFSQSNPIRKFCQALVPPAHGERIFGRPAHPFWSLVLKVTMFFAVVGSLVINSIATPAYRRDFYSKHGFYRATWFDMTEMGLGAVFVFEAAVKIIADGFIFSPNAYLLSIWNVVDFVILVTIIVNTVTEFIKVGGLSRATRALKAFRVLRFITLFSRLRDTFHAVFFAGAMRIIDASILMILYLIPFAVWGLNIFMRRMTGCNDTTGDVTVKDQCVAEFSATPTGSIAFLAPRVWANPAFGPGNSVYSFDSFRTSMLILFEIVSLEGWINVMQTAMGIVGYNQQPGNLTQQWNSIFFLIFNLFGGVIILTVFLSIIIENFSIRSGAALLTSEQKQWIDLSKFIRQQSPSQLPRRRPRTPIRGWCYDRATQKRGYWARFYTFLYFVHIGLLMTEDYSNNVMTEVQLDWTFLGLTVLYAIDIVVRFVGLGFHSFRSNGWNLFDIVTVTGSFATTIPAIEAMRGGNQRSQGTRQVQKLFLVSICLKLVQRLDGLNQLFKTSVASLPAIGNLFLLWAVLFLFMAIVKVEIFGLTKMGNNALTRYQNYHTVGNALVMLAFMSTGENWNGYMHDFTVEFPRCTASNNYLNDDCGSVGWAYVLFSFWNILSMYIFVNMFTGVVVQSFSYVYQMPGGANLSRDQIRSFKRVWAEIDRDRTGYISRRDLVRFFSKLTGVFEVRLYPVEYSIPNMMRTCAPDANSSPKNVVEGEYRSVDVLKLNRQTSQIDYRKVRQRRHKYVKLFYEAKISEVPGRGIGFTQMLTMLAHYKLIDDEKALEVDDLLTRRAKMERVDDLVNLDRVRGLLRTIYWRRRFLAERDQRRVLAQAQDTNIPAIILEPIAPSPEKPSSLFEGLTGPREPLNPYPSDTDFPPLTPVHSRHASTPNTPSRLGSGHHAHAPSPSLTTNADNRHVHVPSPLSSPSRHSHTSPSPAALGLGGPPSPSFTPSYRTALSVHSDADGDLSLGRRVSHASHLSHASFASQGSFDNSYSFDGDTTRDSVFEEPDADEVVQSMATSAWADMMREAVEGEDT